MHEQRAKELLASRIAHLESPSHQKGHLHMWTAVALCSAVFIGTYAFVASKTYHFAEVTSSIAHAAEQVKDAGTKLAPVVEEQKTLWNALQGNLAKEANAQVENNVVQEMKKTIGAPAQPELPKAASKPSTP